MNRPSSAFEVVPVKRRGALIRNNVRLAARPCPEPTCLRLARRRRMRRDSKIATAAATVAARAAPSMPEDESDEEDHVAAGATVSMAAKRGVTVEGRGGRGGGATSGADAGNTEGDDEAGDGMIAVGFSRIVWK